MHLLGQSWGAFLALEYALNFGHHLRGLILASGAASTAECVRGMETWKRALPETTRELMMVHEARGEFDHPDYLSAMDMLYRQNFCRVWPYPEPLARAMEHMSAPVYTTMWGPNEFTCTGNLMTWDRTAQLGDIDVQTLITVGEFDEVHPSCAETLHRGIAGSELAIFAGCGHAVPLEDPVRYRATLLRFLDRVDSVPGLTGGTL
jgi:proline iminopeptidase